MAEKTGYTYYADPQQVDFTLRMTVPALANEVLNTAGVDAQRKGFGIDKLNKENRSWVLSRMAIEIDDRPEQYSSYEIVTWVNGTTGCSRPVISRCTMPPAGSSGGP